jgi:hypothetical protein
VAFKEGDMIQAAFSLVFLLTFWTAARKAGRNKLLWSLIGAASFLIPSSLLPLLIQMVAYEKVRSITGRVLLYDPSIVFGIGIGAGPGLILHFSVVLGSLILGGWIAVRVRRHYLEPPGDAAQPVPPNRVGEGFSPPPPTPPDMRVRTGRFTADEQARSRGL